jgi:mRNA-degrading endonuclease RelE of RelBE toxin-antitoxin system
MTEYRLAYSETAKNQISVFHPQLKSIMRSRLDAIQEELFDSKRLERELSGYRSLRENGFAFSYFS